MKIVFLTNNNHPGTLGGVQTFNRILKSFFKDEMITLTNKTKQSKYFYIEDVVEIGSLNIIYRVLNKLSGRKIEYFLKKKKVKKLKPDICIISSPAELEIIKDIKCKKILVQHNKFSIYLKNYYLNNKNLIELSKKELDYFVFLSDNDMKEFQKKIGFPAEKSIVIRHSAEIDIFSGIKKRNNNLVMIGRIYNQHKRYDLAIEAMKKLKEFTLLIYGDGPDLEKLKEVVNKKKINNVIFKGPTNNIAKALDEASIFVMTSDYEGYPISAIEAARRGVPIILRDTFEASRDIVVDNRNGILLEKEWNEDEFVKAIKKVNNNYDYYCKNVLIEREKYNWNFIKQEWLKLVK